MILKNLMLIVGTWLVITGIVAAIMIYKLDILEYRRLASHGMNIQGVVTAKEPENHQFIHYSYTVNQHSYTGTGNAERGNAEFERLNIGDKVKVYYDPNNPQTSFLGDPAEQLSSMIRGGLFITLLGPLAMVSGLYVKGWLPRLMK
jgi:hypothetical protein